jgi:hypothetical protein
MVRYTDTSSVWRTKGAYNGIEGLKASAHYTERIGNEKKLTDR